MSEIVEAAETAEKIVEEVAEAVAIPNVKLIAGVALVTGLAAGASAGYFFAQRKLRLKYEQISEAEIAEMREHYRAKGIAREDKPDLDKVAEKAAAKVIVEREGYTMGTIPKPELIGSGPRRYDGVTPQDIPVDENVFEGAATDAPPFGWSYEAEKARRTGDRPYVIHRDEIGEMNDAWDVVVLTYFAGDDVVASEDDSTVDNVDELIGLENLQRFGEGSQDPNIVLVRNVGLETEFEISRSDETYAEAIAGFKHSDYVTSERMRKRRRRFDDE